MKVGAGETNSIIGRNKFISGTGFCKLTKCVLHIEELLKDGEKKKHGI